MPHEATGRAPAPARLTPPADYPSPPEPGVIARAAWVEFDIDPETPVQEDVAHEFKAEEVVLPNRDEVAEVPAKADNVTGLDTFSRRAAVVAAVLYAGAFLAQLLWGYYSWETEGVGINWNVSDNPQTAIAVSLMLGAAVLWFARSAAGKALALLPFGFALYQFYLWREATTQLKADLAAEDIPQLSGIGSQLFGAGYLDLFALAAIITLFVIGVYRFVKWLGTSKPNGEAHSVPQLKHASR